MKTFTDPETGKQFRLGSRGYEQLMARTVAYAKKRNSEGAAEVALHPTNIPEGATFKCDTCDEEFTFDGEDQEAFINSIKEHGRTHGVCQILPVL